MSHATDAKTSSSRVPLDHFKRDDSINHWKLRLGGVAFVIALAWAGTHAALSEQRDFHSSRGPVHAVHQSWEMQCSTCHVDFTPISSYSWAAPFLSDATESSLRCKSCHEGAVHHTSQSPELACGSCHREHRGRDASLVRLPDSDCTQCHKELHGHKRAHPAPEKPFANAVIRFDDSHPRFRSIEKDPGKLKFNHQLHLAEGMANGKDGGKRFTFVQIEPEYRQRYMELQGAKDGSAFVK